MSNPYPPGPPPPVRPVPPPRHRAGGGRTPVWPLVLIGVLVVAVLGGLLFAAVGDRDGPSFPPPPPDAPPDPGIPPPEVDLDDPQAARALVADWAATYADVVEIPEPALRAYGYAAAVTAQEDSGCELSWTILAGIGAVESNHGRFEGATLDDSGRSDPPIRGLPLDGGPGRLEITDTDGGALDGDEVYDRAVGPLQFIPTTWELYGVDADGDGVADPDDLDDAALAAASYLCASADDLDSAEGWWQAVLTYNRSTQYGMNVLARADAYGTASRAL